MKGYDQYIRDIWNCSVTSDLIFYRTSQSSAHFLRNLSSLWSIPQNTRNKKGLPWNLFLNGVHMFVYLFVFIAYFYKTNIPNAYIMWRQVVSNELVNTNVKLVYVIAPNFRNLLTVLAPIWRIICIPYREVGSAFVDCESFSSDIHSILEWVIAGVKSNSLDYPSPLKQVVVSISKWERKKNQYINYNIISYIVVVLFH